MAAADLSVGGDNWATIEADDVKHLLTIDAGRGSLLNIGPETVFLGLDPGVANLQRDSLQRLGEIPVPINSSIPISLGRTRVVYQCEATKTATLLWVPTVG